MDPLETAYRQQHQQELKQQEQKARADVEAAREAATATFARLEALANNPEFQWFFSTFVAPIVAEQRRSALDVTLGAQACFNHNQRHDIALQIAELIDERRQFFKNEAGIE